MMSSIGRPAHDQVAGLAVSNPANRLSDETPVFEAFA
jgi:hypothetical protein